MTDSTIEHLTPLVTLEWLADHRIMVYTNPSPNRGDIDAYMDHLTELTLQWDKSQPFLVLHDYTNAAYTPYARQRVQQYFNIIPPNLWGRSAAVLPATMVGNLMRFFATQLMAKHHPLLELRYFTHKPTALAWLKEGLTPRS